MSKSKVDKPEKKRKRDVEVAEDVPKKSKKSKKTEDTQDAPTPEAPVVEVAEVKKDKKSKKDKKEKKSKDNDTDASEDAPADETELIEEMKTSENFINVNDDEPMPDATEDAPVKDKKKSKKDKDSKKSKKSKKATEAEDTAMEDVEDTPAETNGVDVDSKAAKKEKKKDKKEKKEKKTKKTKESESNGDVLTEDTAAEAEMGEEVEVEGEEAQAAVEANQGRFIVFVGNLPYSATKEEIEKHFEKIKPSEIRLRTYKGTEKFMGTCFVEFDRYDRMVTCLKKYHHSVFPDPKKKEGRKINVELSAGGGGNSETRKTKIAAKNEKLHDERARDRIKEAEVSMKQRERKEKKEAKSGKKADKKEEEPAAEKPSEAETFGMNPARLAMMQGPAVPHRSRY
ncbi:RNA binding protein [Pyrenophora tritici-repentis]|uniref:RNA-binding protein (RRM domain) n=1 Tax=Pyrenophora tritici-repentis TaxID=45151 RepID=A0A834RI95_9PLEO|nr:RNA-binding protein (RRM domain) [Pyrenophora tritici-repentis]KAI0584016.1 RNA binding protein [Pyrenophora tritici-repentis]KAI0590407.1 RNA binding protein [Pyrenophora tritici-repentis]KAI0612544.1 RNA binding protein [Pyrenophora tritici-repentis]KAI0623821.1 RNA binding protein [Pyrenophora tritici-repentis]